MLRTVLLLLLLLLLLLTGPVAWGQAPAPAITGPPGTYTSTLTLTAPGPVSLVAPWTGPAGVYTIALPAGSIVTQTASGITITWGSPAPPPTPPAPTLPTTGPYFVAMVTDGTAPLPAGQTAIQGSTTIDAAIKSANPANTWTKMDVSAATLGTWSTAARAAGLPCLLVLSTDASTGRGYKVEAIPLPADEASVVAEIKRLASGGAPR